MKQSLLVDSEENGMKGLQMDLMIGSQTKTMWAGSLAV